MTDLAILLISLFINCPDEYKPNSDWGGIGHTCQYPSVNITINKHQNALHGNKEACQIEAVSIPFRKVGIVETLECNTYEEFEVYVMDKRGRELEKTRQEFIKELQKLHKDNVKK